jgi:hypothetical protein
MPTPGHVPRARLHAGGLEVARAALCVGVATRSAADEGYAFAAALCKLRRTSLGPVARAAFDEQKPRRERTAPEQHQEAHLRTLRVACIDEPLGVGVFGVALAQARQGRQ